MIPGGMVGFGGIGVLGKDQYASDLIAVYTFARSTTPTPSTLQAET